MSESVSVCQCAGGPMESKEEKPTAPLLRAVHEPAQLLPAVQPAPLSAAVQPAVQFAAVQQINKSWTSPNDTSRAADPGHLCLVFGPRC